MSGLGEPASPRLEACAPVGSCRLGARLAGVTPGARVLQSSDLPSQATQAVQGSCCRLGRGSYRERRHFLATQMPSGAWPGWKVTHSSGVQWPANLEVSLGLAQDTRPPVKTKGCGLGAAARQGQAFFRSPASLPAVPRSEIQLLPPGPGGHGPSLLPGPRGKVVAARAPRVSLPGRTPLPRGGGEPGSARARRRRPRPTPPAGPDRL